MHQKVILSSISSDSHVWNLIYLQLLLEELNFEVINLGPSVATQDLVKACHRHKPEHLVISSVNGHGYIKGIEIIRAVRQMNLLKNMKVVIGGKLSVNGMISNEQIRNLHEEGFDGVFVKSTAIEEFRYYMQGKNRLMRVV